MSKWLQSCIINVKKLHEDAVIPKYSKASDGAMDLTATSRTIEDGNVAYGTGLAMAIPPTHVGLIFPRSSVSKKPLSLANCVGVIDSGYRGEIVCKFKPTPSVSNIDAMMSTGTEEVKAVGIPKILYEEELYEVGDRVAQIMIIERPLVMFSEVDELDDTERGKGGFGSTGK